MVRDNAEGPLPQLLGQLARETMGLRRAADARRPRGSRPQPSSRTSGTPRRSSATRTWSTPGCSAAARPSLARLLEMDLGAQTDPSRRVGASVHGSRSGRATTTRAPRAWGGREPPPVEPPVAVGVGLVRDSARQPAVRDDRRAGRLPALGARRIDQDTWSFTFRVNVSITPDLTLQYYGSPFIGTGRYTAFKKATDTLAKPYGDRFHLYGPDEIAYGQKKTPTVTEAEGGPSYSFANPDFSFRQFRSNLVARWEWKPGSSLYVVWSQGRTSYAPEWDDSFSSNWDALRGRAPTTSSW